MGSGNLRDYQPERRMPLLYEVLISQTTCLLILQFGVKYNVVTELPYLY
jgi:hypothetical protein